MAEMGELPLIQLVTTQLLNSPERIAALEAFLEANSAEPLIRRIVVLAEQLDPALEPALQQRFSKLILCAWCERPDLNALVDAAREHGDPGAITAICNADIWFDLQHSDPTSLRRALLEQPQLAFSLTRRHDGDPERLLSVDGVLPEFASSDAWLFSGCPRPFPLAGVLLGSQDVERLVNAGLQQAGYRLANACSWVRAIHLEQSPNNYSAFNLDQLYQTTLGNPALAAAGIPPALVVLPPALGTYASGLRLHPDRFTETWEAFAQRWILVDLRGSLLAACQSAVLWLLFLVRSHQRTLIAAVDRDTDPALVELLDHFNTSTGLALCLQGVGFDRLAQQGFLGDGLWLSSPAALGPNLLIDAPARPMVLLNVEEPRPIKGSWLAHYSLNSVREQLQAMALVEPTAAVQTACSASLNWQHVQLVSCTTKADAFVSGFLKHSAGWITTSAAYGHGLLHTFCDVQPTAAQRQLLLHALRQRPGWLLEFKDDPGLYEAWNRMIRCSEEPYITNANPDDRRSPDHLGRLVDQLAAAPERLVASSAVVPIQHRRCLAWSFERLQQQAAGRFWFGDVEDGYGLERLSRTTAAGLEPHNVPHCSPVWRRELHQRHGWFDEGRYGSAADWALWCRYGFAGGRFCHSPEPLSGYFVNASSYGRTQAETTGHQRIVAEFLQPEQQPTPMPASSAPALQMPPQPVRMRIHAADAFYGDHRFSNNQILASLAHLHDEAAELRFIWFLERFFLWGNGPGERLSWDFAPIQQPWIGVLHVPPLTPKWAGNQFAELYALREWRQSLPHCRGLITLSTYMARDLRHLYPQLPIYAVKHPVQAFSQRFDLEAFLAEPKVVLVGYWLRQHRQFYRWRAPFPKIHLLKRYSIDLMNREWQALGSPSEEELSSVEQRRFLPPAAFDQLLSSSLVFLSLYETSGNNAVAECLAMGTPFVAERHPALEEYVGVDYPLLVEPGELEQMGRDELLSRTISAHAYLVKNEMHRLALSYEAFGSQIESIVEASGRA